MTTVSDSARVAPRGVIEYSTVTGTVAKALGGGNVNVTSIINSTNVEAHDYEPTTADIAKLQKKLSEARARQSSVVNRLESAENRYKLREMTNGDRVEDAFSRFEILERRVDEAEGRADALGLGYKKSLDEEIADLQAADKVADELAALKAAQGKK